MEFLVERKNLHNLVARSCPMRDLADGEVLVKVERFALTSNNITYAVVADQIGYFEFYPATDESSGDRIENFGIIPVWGIGKIVGSKSEKVPVGEIIYGFFPMGSYCIFKPVKVTENSFFDGAEHRAQLPPVYSSYVRTKNDPMYSVETEAFACIMRPLYLTAWSLMDFFVQSDFHGADAVIISSSSSKTAIGFAWELTASKARAKKIGLTSEKNVAYVTSLGIYDQVVPYSEVDSIDASQKVVYVDMSGNIKLLETIHKKFDSNLKFSSLVGQTHWNKSGLPQDLKGPTPEFFFAPAVLGKRSAEMGPQKFGATVTKAWHGLVKKATESDWFNITPLVGTGAIKDMYLKFLEGSIDPKNGYICSFSEEAKI